MAISFIVRRSDAPRQTFYGPYGQELITNAEIINICDDGLIHFKCIGAAMPTGPWFNSKKQARDYFGEVETGENEMGMTDNAVIEMFQDFQVIGVFFDYNKSEDNRTKMYSYKAPKSLELKKGDFVVVNTNSTGEPPLKVVQVAVVGCPVSSNAGHKWIVDVVDMTGYNMLMENEGKIADILKRAREARERKIRMADLQEFMTPEDIASIAALTGKALPDESLKGVPGTKN